MQRSLATILSCGACRAPFVLEVDAGDESRIDRGVLRCNACGSIVPICAGFPLFGERLDAEGQTLDLEALERRLFGPVERYADFVREKHRRPVRDLYAAFAPFNEPSVGFSRFVANLREILRPGDRILDTWCRTGWSGECLAALFPDQTIVSLWERNVDVLGYRGFRFWLSEGARASNLEIVFHDPNEPLPFVDGCFATTHGADSLHRYDLDTLVSEVLRVTRSDGITVFPHVHLSNGEPDPWFDRGCAIRHGQEYARFLEERLAGSGQRAFVLSERALFERNDVRLEDDAQTTHYNGLVAIAPEELEGRTLSVERRSATAGSRPVVHPLLEFDLHAATVRLDDSRFEGEVGRILDRHPIQRAALLAHVPARLGRAECEVLYGASRALTLEAIAAETSRPTHEILTTAQRMSDRGWIELAPISEAMARLQCFYAEQVWLAPRADQTVNALFDAACARHPERPLIHVDSDGSIFRYADAAEVVSRIAARLRSAGVRPGDRIGLVAPFSVEAALAFWGCLRAGAVLVPIDWMRPAPFAKEILEGLQVRIVFCDPEREGRVDCEDIPCVVFDDTPDQEPSGRARCFSDWVDETGPGSDRVEPVAPDAPAIILHTSGTTGRPKALTLSHGSLFRTGEWVARTWGWHSEDRLASTGDLHAMSGVRNPCVAVLHAGASFLTIPADLRANPMALADCLGRNGATLCSTTPAALGALLRFEERIPRHALHALRQVICTAATLPRGLSEAFEARYDAPVHDYYGLTETGGVCVGNVPGDKPEGIGRPLGCMAQIVSESGEIAPAGEVGELWIFTENRAEEMAVDESAVLGQDGWCRTGDLAVRDDSGQIRLLGRRREILKDARGELISPAEIEAVLREATDVEDAGVCGIENEEGSETMVAFIVVRKGTEDPRRLRESLRRLALERLGAGRVPARVEIVDQLPRAADGGLQRSRLADVARAGEQDRG